MKSKKGSPSRPNLRYKKKPLSYAIYKVIKATGWTIEELKKCPIPTFWLILRYAQEEEEQKSKQWQ